MYCAFSALKFNITKIINPYVTNVKTVQERWNFVLLFYFDLKSVQQVSLFNVLNHSGFEANYFSLFFNQSGGTTLQDYPKLCRSSSSSSSSSVTLSCHSPQQPPKVSRQGGEPDVEFSQTSDSGQQASDGGQQILFVRPQPPHIQCSGRQRQGLQLGQLQLGQHDFQVNDLKGYVVYDLQLGNGLGLGQAQDVEKLLERERVRPEAQEARLQRAVAHQVEDLSHQLVVAARDEAVQAHVDRGLEGPLEHLGLLHGHDGLVAHSGQQVGSGPAAEGGAARARLVFHIPQGSQVHHA